VPARAPLSVSCAVALCAGRASGGPRGVPAAHRDARRSGPSSGGCRAARRPRRFRGTSVRVSEPLSGSSCDPSLPFEAAICCYVAAEGIERNPGFSTGVADGPTTPRAARAAVNRSRKGGKSGCGLGGIGSLCCGLAAKPG